MAIQTFPVKWVVCPYLCPPVLKEICSWWAYHKPHSEQKRKRKKPMQTEFFVPNCLTIIKWHMYCISIQKRGPRVVGWPGAISSSMLIFAGAQVFRVPLSLLQSAPSSFLCPFRTTSAPPLEKHSIWEADNYVHLMHWHHSASTNIYHAAVRAHSIHCLIFLKLQMVHETQRLRV
jgi:hypothetical protein